MSEPAAEEPEPAAEPKGSEPETQPLAAEEVKETKKGGGRGGGGCCGKPAADDGGGEGEGEGEGDGDGAHPKDVTQEAPKEFDGFLQGKKPNGKSRKCTDLLCLGLFLACWLVQIYMGAFAYEYARSGEGPGPKVLLNGVDYKGRICGLDEGVVDKPYWTIVSWTGLGKCTDTCPKVTQWQDIDPFDPDDIDKLICKDEADQDQDEFKQFPFYKIYFGECIYSFQSVEMLNYCVINDMKTIKTVMEKVFPFDDDTSEVDDEVSEADLSDPSKITPKMMLKKLTASTSFLTDAMGDAYNARAHIFAFGFGMSLFLSFMYSHAMKVSIITNTVVWGSIMAIFGAAVVVSGYAYYLVTMWEQEEPMTRTPLDIKRVNYIVHGGFGFAVFWLCFILYMRDRLNLAIGLVIETSRALASMTFLVISIPLFQVIFYTIATVPWVFGLVYMAAMGDVSTATGGFYAGTVKVEYAYKQFSYNEQQQKYAWFYLFGYFWTSEFIVALGQMITSMSLCCYYFTRDKKRIGNSTVFSALRLICRYHLGTVAFGSCIVALVRLLRAYITYLEQTALKNKTKFQKFLAAVLECFMYCIERCIKYINFNAYIQTCIWGSSFCVSAFNAFWLIFRNLARIVAVTGVTSFLSLIGKVMVIALSGGTFVMVMQEHFPNQVKSLIMPTVLVCLIAAAVSIMFFEVFNMGTTVLLQCYIADEEMFKDDPEGCFAPMTLKAYLMSKKKKKKKKKGIQAKGGSKGQGGAEEEKSGGGAAAEGGGEEGGAAEEKK